MSLLNPISPPAVPFKRPTETAYGDTSFVDLGDTPVVVSFQRANVSQGDGPGYTQQGLVFTPRSLDRKRGDRFVYNGVDYVLVGERRGDHLHPFTGEDFGWVAHTIERI